MFTTKDSVQQQLTTEGWEVDTLTYIDKGVMTDTYCMTTAHKKYCVRCYPPFRSWLAKVEFDLLLDFQKHGIKSPLPVAFNGDGADVSYLIYEWVEGPTLREYYDQHPDEDYTTLCQQIIDNYVKIGSIKTKKYGRVAKGRMYQHNTWVRFLKWEIELSRKYFNQAKDQRHANICDGLYEYSEKIAELPSNLVWSDFSLDNIIINENKQLIAFIDFEGIMSGDPVVGISYLKSQEPEHPLTTKLLNLYKANNDETINKHIDFYSVFRYIRLSPYSSSSTPNGSERVSTDEFLPYVHTVDEQFNKPCNKKQRFKRFLYYMWKKIIIIGITIGLAFWAIVNTYKCYEPVIRNSHIIQVAEGIKGLQIDEELPIWFSIDGDTLKTYKILDEADVRLLYSCVSTTDSLATQSKIASYKKAVSHLAYKSNTEFPNTYYLVILTFCLVYLGCTARTIYDFIGWECFKGGQDMETWWPWYVFRPFIGVPITSFLLVACRTSMFSSLFTSRDLNTYLVISFLAGFAMMEFVTMLRRSSHALFGEGKK